MASDEQFLGLGWAFPPAFDNQGRSLKMAADEQDIQESLGILLSTSIGERVMRPNFGWRREALMFEPLSTTFAASLKHEIETAILYFEPRIDVNKLTFEANDPAAGLIMIRLDYTIRATNARNNLVFPFYLDEANNAP